MCGIAGILSLSPERRVDPAALRTMAAQLVHRGPDAEGFYLDPQARCGLAFRRLSIIDLSTGHQPMPNEDRTVWLVFNGEIYNFRELRAGLEARGHRLATRSDAETIVHLYEEEGPELLGRLAGMFALALWDERRGRLLLARDRLGKKPLVWGVVDGRLYFASELKAILALPGIPRRIDLASLQRYLVFQYVPAPHCIFQQFRKLPPGSLLELAAPAVPPPAYERSAAGAAPHADRGPGPASGPPTNPAGAAAQDVSLQPRVWWAVPSPAPFAGTYADAKARLGELLTQAVRRRLIADVPLGAFLSGGIDSSIVVHLMHELGVRPVRTFSIGFAETRYDETRYARRVARRLGTDHHERIVTPDARELLDKLAWHYDEPFADSSAIPTCYVARHARQHVTVALTGDGGDECFAGYERYQAASLLACLDRLPAALRSMLARVAARIPHGRARSLPNRLHRLGVAADLPPPQRYLSWMQVLAPSVLEQAWREEVAAGLDPDEPRRWFCGLFEEARGPDAQRANQVDFRSYLPFDLLTKVDVASMAFSLECRCPLLDHELVEFALSLPLEWKLGCRDGKRILKDWARDRLDAAILRRPKMGFGVPVGEWFRRELREEIRAALLDPQGINARLFRPRWLEHLLNQHLSGRANLEHPLWALLMLHRWWCTWQPQL